MIVLARTGAHTFPAVADCTDIDLFHIADCTDLFHSRILAITFFCFFFGIFRTRTGRAAPPAHNAFPWGEETHCRRGISFSRKLKFLVSSSALTVGNKYFTSFIKSKKLYLVSSAAVAACNLRCSSLVNRHTWELGLGQVKSWEELGKSKRQVMQRQIPRDSLECWFLETEERNFGHTHKQVQSN